MKLWQRIFFCAFLLTLLAVDVTMIVTLNLNFRTTVERETDRAAIQNAYYTETLRSEVVYRRLQEGRLRLQADQVEEIIGEMVQNQQAGTDRLVVCSSDGEPVGGEGRQELAMLPEEFRSSVQAADSMLSMIVERDGRSYMLTGSPTELETEAYPVYTVSDVTAIYRGLEQQLQFSRIASLVFAGLTGGVLILVVLRLLRPLNQINAGLGRIAGGDYGLRLPDYRSPEFHELSGNINRMSASIEKNVEEVQGLADERQRFVDNFAHEMKTPLTSVMGFADLMRIQKDMDEKKRREYAGIILDQTRRLQILSAKMLQLSSLHHVSLEFRRTEINKMFFSVYKTVLPLMVSRKVHLKVEPAHGGAVDVDPELFELLLSNLVDNAGKASEAGKTVRLRAERREEAWVFHVEDQGVGMSEEELRHVLEPFYMADKSRSRRSGGVGLGLSLCARIVELHGGELKIDSRPGEGTRVTVVLKDRKGGDDDEQEK